MEPKKSKKADLEKKKVLFLEIGFILALGLVLLAFEWGTKTKEVKGFSSQEKADVAQESVPVTRQQQKKQPPPPPPPQTTEVINIVDNDVTIDDELDIQTSEADQDTKVDYDAFGQEEEEEEEEQVFVVVEDMPKFKGKSINAFRNFVQRNIEYPPIAMENGIQGTVFMKFIVDTDGGISDVTVLRGPDPSLNEEAIRAVKNAPSDWDPGRQRGKPVRVSCTMPIIFKLE
jgi:protein TonB